MLSSLFGATWRSERSQSYSREVKTRTLENHKGCGTRSASAPPVGNSVAVGEAKDAERRLTLRRDKAGRASRPDSALRLGARS
jgi:hypothetical protein